MDINTMLSDLMRVEGGYVNNKNDAGGETNFGITKETAVRNGYTGPMSALTKDIAIQIYRSEYFFGPNFGKVFDTGLTSVAAELFDTCVNMGTGTASAFLQRILNALNNQGTLYPDLTVDGKIGPATINALTTLVKRRGLNSTESVLLKALNAQQCVRYIELSEKRPQNEDFVWGWIDSRVGMPN